jgi:predicted DNA-binding antitoxin AbrB/MazE fold protein
LLIAQRVKERNVVMKTITAIFEDGVLKPSQPLKLAEHAQVRITVEPLEASSQKAEKLAALEALWRITKRHSEHLTREDLHERR